MQLIILTFCLSEMRSVELKRHKIYFRPWGTPLGELRPLTIDPMVGWRGDIISPIPFPPRHFRRLYLGVFAVSKSVPNFYHRLRGCGSTVVTMTSKVNGEMEISTPRRSETPRNIETKFGLNDYVMDPYKRANFRGDRSKGVCSPNR